MDDVAADIARSTARHLAPTEGSHILGDVEAALAGGNRATPVDPIAVGALIVSVAQLAWTILLDLRSRHERPERETVSRNVRVRVRVRDEALTSRQNHIIEVVLDEAFAQDDPTTKS